MERFRSNLERLSVGGGGGGGNLPRYEFGLSTCAGSYKNNNDRLDEVLLQLSASNIRLP